MPQVKDFDKNYPFDDEFVDSIKYAKGRKIEPSMLVVHFAVARSLPWLVQYFHEDIWKKDKRTASTHYCVGADGKVVGMVNFADTAWTVGNGSRDQKLQKSSYGNMKYGWWYDHKGNITSLVNDMSINFETCLYPQDPVPDAIYQSIADRCRYHIKTMKEMRVWRICGHEHMCPDAKTDPGVQWDWEKFFVKYMSVKPDFYKDYLSFLDDSKHIGMQNYIEKRIVCLDAAKKLCDELKDKSSSFALNENWL